VFPPRDSVNEVRVTKEELYFKERKSIRNDEKGDRTDESMKKQKGDTEKGENQSTGQTLALQEGRKAKATAASVEFHSLFTSPTL
jgi:hypothetical protein